MKSRFLAVIACAAATLLPAAPASAAIVFSFTPASSNIEVGESVVIDATISGLDDEILSAFDLNFVYDPGVIDWNLIQYFGANLGNAIGVNTNGLPDGDLGFDDSSLDDDATLAASQGNSFVLFRFTLVGLANGVTNFTLGPDLDFQRNFVGRDFASLDVQVGSACIAVGTGRCGDAQVPEPATLALLGLGLLGAGLSRRLRAV